MSAEELIAAKKRVRIIRLEAALRGLLTVVWPNDDPKSRTAIAIRKAKKALKE